MSCGSVSANTTLHQAMDSEKIPTLAKNFPDVLLALLQRMSPAEREAALKDFEAQSPKNFKAWYTAEVEGYLNFTRPQ